MHFQILGSSSSGNAALLSTPSCTILIDAGFSGKQIQLMLQSLGRDISEIDAIFITHEHGDHSNGLKGLSRFKHLRFISNKATALALQEKLSTQLNWICFETGTTFKFKDLEVTSFSIPHDAVDPVGYLFNYKEDVASLSLCKLAWVTDLGFIPKLVEEKIRQANILVIECNYDTNLLNNTSNRPWSVKQRIKGRHGHLSNKDTFDFISKTKENNWQKIYLCHISRECNHIDHVKETFQPLLNSNFNYNIEIIDPNKTCFPKFEYLKESILTTIF